MDRQFPHRNITGDVVKMQLLLLLLLLKNNIQYAFVINDSTPLAKAALRQNSSMLQ